MRDGESTERKEEDRIYLKENMETKRGLYKEKDNKTPEVEREQNKNPNLLCNN